MLGGAREDDSTLGLAVLVTRRHRMCVAAILIAGVSALVSHASALGPEVDLTTAFDTSTAGSQRSVLTARDGEGYVTLYVDRTCEDERARVVHLAADGTVIAELEVRVPTPSALGCHDGLCLAGTVGGVFSETERVFSRGSVVRFDDAGASFEELELGLGTGAAFRFVDEIAAGPDGFSVLYRVQRSGGPDALLLQRVPRSGEPHPPVTLASDVSHAHLACRVDSCLLVTEGPRGIETQRVRSDGVALEAPRSLVLPTGTWVELALRATGDGWVIAVESEFDVIARNTTQFGYRVGRDGATSAPLPLGTGRPWGSAGPLLGCDDAGRCVVQCTTDDPLLDVLGVWEGGVFAPGSDVVAGRGVENPQIVCASDACVRVGERTGFEVFVERMTLDAGGVTRSVVGGFGHGPDWTAGPLAMASGTDGALVAFTRAPSAFPMLRDVVLQPLDVLGAPVTERGVTLGSLDESEASEVDLVRAGTRYALLASGMGSATLWMLEPDGTVAEGPIDLGWVNARGAALGWNGASLLVAHIAFPTDLVIERFDGALTRLEAPRTIASAYRVAVASDGWGFLVTWTMVGLRGARISSMGELLDPLAPGEIWPGFEIDAEGGMDVEAIHVAPDYLVAWSIAMRREIDPEHVYLDWRATFAHVSPHGVPTAAVSRPLVTTDASDERVRLALAQGRGGSWLLWSLPVLDAGARTLRAAGFGITGEPMGRTIELIDDPREAYLWSESRGTIAAAGESIVYARRRILDGDVASRVVLRSLRPEPMGAACVVPADCAGGWCVDGVCCEHACDGACDVCDASGTCRVGGGCVDATIATLEDAGPDVHDAAAAGDAPGDAAIVTDAATPAEDHASCSASRPQRSSWLIVLGCLMALARLRARAARRGADALDVEVRASRHSTVA